MSVQINKTTIINGGGYFNGCCRGYGFTPYFSGGFSPGVFGWGRCCISPWAPLAASAGFAIGTNFPAVCKGVWSGIKAVGKGIGWLAKGAWKGITNFFGWVGRGFKPKPKPVEKTEEPKKDDNTQKAS